MIRVRPAAAALLAAALIPGAVRAGDGGPDFQRSPRKAFEIAKERGWAVLFWCTQDSEPDCKTDSELLKNPRVLEAMRGFLVCFGNHEMQHGSRPGTLDGKPAKLCNLVPSIECDDHKAVIDFVYGSFPDVCVNKSAEMKLPVHFVVNSDGKVLGTINNGTKEGGFAPVEAGKMIDGLKALLAKAGGPGLDDARYDALQKALASARSSVDQKRLAEAAQALAPILELKKNITLVRDAKELLARVDKEAAPRFAKAKGLLGSDPVAAIAALEEIAREYPGTDSAEQARKAADEFKASPEGKKALRDLAREAEGQGELKKALESAGDGKDDARYLRLLDGIAKKYDGLPAGAEARKRAEAVRSDPERAKALEAAAAEKEARSALTLAKAYLDGGKKDEAKKALQAIVDRHAGTKAAEEAAKLLEGLR
jgi:hypothetical protein